jgi:hypothetical protein
MLTAELAFDIADRSQRRGLLDALAFGAAMGSPVRFICRRGPDGPEFEAVMIHSARTCATVSAEGELTWLAGRRARDPWTDAGVPQPRPRFTRPWTERPAIAERAATAERPATERPAPIEAPLPGGERRPQPAPQTADAPTLVAPPSTPAGAPACERRRSGIRLALGAHTQAALTLEWGACDQTCCRSAQPPPAARPGPMRLRAGRWHVTLDGRDGRPVASLAITGR